MINCLLRSPLLFFALSFFLGACGGGGTPAFDDYSSELTYGEPFASGEGRWAFPDANESGYAQEPRITGVYYGRQVEVFGLDAFGSHVLMFSDLVIGPSIISDGQKYLRATNQVTAQEILVVLRDVTDKSPGGGREDFFDLVFDATQAIAPIHPQAPGGSGLYSMVPRNAVIVLQFDDLIDPATLGPATLSVRVGHPPVAPLEARIYVDPNHGGLADHDGQPGPEFYGTRVVVDPVVTELEAYAVDPPLLVNGIGLPPGADVNLSNLELRIPTQLNVNAGQTSLLRNLSGHAITAKNNGPVDGSEGTLDLVRAARSGGNTGVTGDDFNGFLIDLVPPTLVGQAPVVLEQPPIATGDASLFILPRMRFEGMIYAQTPHPGDVLRQPGLYAEVVNQPAPVGGDGIAKNVLVRLLLHPFGDASEWTVGGSGAGQFLFAFDEDEDGARAACFVDVSPKPLGAPHNPVSGLRTDSSFSLRFSEPMDPTSLTAFDSAVLTRSPPPDEGALPTSDYVIGSLHQSVDLLRCTFFPDLPLAHQEGVAEPYWLSLRAGEEGPTDLAGNPLSAPLSAVEMVLDPTEVTQHNSGRVTRFSAVDEEPPFGDLASGPLPEWSGQLLYDLQRELVRPRPVVHFNVAADRSQPVPKLMQPYTQGLQTPLSGFGSKAQVLWRYCDLGFSLTDSNDKNLDVEGLYWSPAGGVVAETFPEFSISMGHAINLPDEYLNPGTVLPKYPDSGLNEKFSNNFLKKPDVKVVHKRELGYSINPGDQFNHPGSGTPLMPFPWNRGAGADGWTTWTWRNTALRKRGGKKGSGAPIMQEFIATGQAAPPNIGAGVYRVDNVLADALPMLMEFRCYPADGVIGLNAFDVSFASNTSIKPYLRAFSSGGYDTDSNPVLVHPDQEEVARGGFTPPSGASTPGLDNTFYIGAADFVTRVSRAHSVWFPASDPFGEEAALFDAPIYLEPITEPRPEDQPDGTKLRLHVRGAADIRGDLYRCCGSLGGPGVGLPGSNGTPGQPLVPNRLPLETANSLDSFGDYYDLGCMGEGDLPVRNEALENRSCDAYGDMQRFILFMNDEEDWLPTTADIAGSRYYQVRLTFEANIHTGLVPELSALALAWYD
jgi:hypothetical protein